MGDFCGWLGKNWHLCHFVLTDENALKNLHYENIMTITNVTFLQLLYFKLWYVFSLKKKKKVAVHLDMVIYYFILIYMQLTP